MNYDIKIINKKNILPSVPGLKNNKSTDISI